MSNIKYFTFFKYSSSTFIAGATNESKNEVNYFNFKQLKIKGLKYIVKNINFIIGKL
jgi:hypothetical protein